VKNNKFGDVKIIHRYNVDILILVKILVLVFFLLRLKRPELRVTVGNQLQCMLGNKQRALGVVPGGGSVPVFRKNGTGIVLNWPQDANGAR